MIKSKSLSIVGAIALHLCLLAGCANAPAVADKPSNKPSPAIAENGLVPDLKVGMSAELIRKQLGDPADIMPMEPTAGKTEVWVYKIDRFLGTTQVVTGTQTMPAFALNTTDKLGQVEEPVYTIANRHAEITLSLLLIDGRLIAQKASAREYLDYNK
jgi:hypothetical protein